VTALLGTDEQDSKKKHANSFVTEFWKITHMGAPETIRIFEFSMALLITETTFKNISKLYF